MVSENTRPRGWHTRGYLPHFDGGEVAQMVTFRLADSLPQTWLDRWREELPHQPGRGANTAYRRRIESYLDKGMGSAWLKDPRVAGIVVEALAYFDGERYRLCSWVVMPNHVHVLVRPLAGYSLETIVQTWKSFTAKRANNILGRSGVFWQADYFDRYIRDRRHFEAAVSYIEANPVNAKLCARREDWAFSSASAQALGGAERLA